MNIEQLIYLKAIARETDKSRLCLVSESLKRVKLSGVDDKRFNLVMDIRSIVINRA